MKVKMVSAFGLFCREGLLQSAFFIYHLEQISNSLQSKLFNRLHDIPSFISAQATKLEDLP
jgi:hypothetical protein